MDIFSKEKRSDVMSRIRSKNTKPEIAVRKYVHSLGYRFSLHGKKLPGKPDSVLTRHRKVIFVHGCFWHRHDCKKASMPKSNLEYWIPKFERNVERDRSNREYLAGLGWKVLVLWECEISKKGRFKEIIQDFLIE